MLKGGISMVAADTKTLLLKSTSRIISERGFGRLTLDAVCKEAGVSKGGLLYHFQNKEALIQGLNYYVLQNTQQYIHAEEKNSRSFTEAYLRATIKSLDASNEDLKIFPGLIASLSESGELLSEWKQEYENIQQRLEADEVSKEFAHIVRLVGDGLWFAQMFDLSPIKTDDALRLANYLLDLLEKENE